MLKIRYLNTEHSSSSLFFCALYKCLGYNPKPKSKPADFPSSYMVLWTSSAGRENLQTNSMEAARDMSVVKGHARTQRPAGRSREPYVPPHTASASVGQGQRWGCSARVGTQRGAVPAVAGVSPIDPAPQRLLSFSGLFLARLPVPQREGGAEAVSLLPTPWLTAFDSHPAPSSQPAFLERCQF